MNLKTPTTSDTTARPHLPWRTLVAVATIALGASAAQLAWAQPDGSRGHQRGAMGEGHPGGHARAGSPGQMDRMLDAVKATPEQRAQIKQITEAARADSAAQREVGRQLREQNRLLFTQPTVDARTAETLRQQMMAQHDQASKRMLQVKLDISRVLSPEQRAAWAERMKMRGERMQQHRHGRDEAMKPRT